MKVQIRDKEALDSLTVENLRAYLETHGWGNGRPWGTWATILSKEERGKTWEVSVPNEAGGILYAESVAEIIATLSEAEDRSQLDVFYDLVNPVAGAMLSDNQNGTANMANVWCVRSDGGKYTEHFIRGGYSGYGSQDWPDFSDCKNSDDVREILAPKFPAGTSKNVIGAYTGMMARFLFEMQAGDWIITPEENSRFLRYGKVEPGGCRYISNAPDGCPYTMRRKIVWSQQTLLRDTLSMPLQFTLGASRTVFAVEPREDFLVAIGQMDKQAYESIKSQGGRADRYQLALDRVVGLDAYEFQFLVEELLVAMGFEDTTVSPPGKDEGVDVTGRITVPGLVPVKVFAQVKRYKAGKNISANAVKNLRASIPMNAQGAFFTTTAYTKRAVDIATEAGFPPISLIDGHQLVDLLIQHWDKIPEDFQEKLEFVRPQA